MNVHVSHRLIIRKVWFFSSNVHWYPESGLRASSLHKYLDLAESYDAVVLFCGNNDLSQHPLKPWLLPNAPIVVAQSINNFKKSLLMRNPHCILVVIGLIPRHDVSREKITDTNSFLETLLPDCYTSPRDIRALGHFENDDIHLNQNMGVYHAVRLFKRKIEYVI